mgnify:CR=1 FL=1
MRTSSFSLVGSFAATVLHGPAALAFGGSQKRVLVTAMGAAGGDNMKWVSPPASDASQQAVKAVEYPTELYPDVEPWDVGSLDVGDGHTLYYEQSGNPNGVPAIFLHGGPGAGCDERSRRFFDPVFYRIVVFDQRGSGRSVPNAADDLEGSLVENTTPKLVADIEALRLHLKISKWGLVPPRVELIAGAPVSSSMLRRRAIFAALNVARGAVADSVSFGCVVSLGPGCIYPFMKRVTWWPQAVLGLTFSWGVPLGWAAVTDQWPTPEIWLIYAGSVAWVFGYDTIYAVQDMADDRITGVKSSALSLGSRLNLGVLIAFCVAILLISAGIQAHQGPGVWMLGVVLMAIHLLRQARMINPDDPKGALTLFKSNRNAGLILTLFLIVDRLLG